MLSFPYRVECVDPDTGKTLNHVFQAANPKEAAELAARLGYAVGRITVETPAPSLPRPKHVRRWVWFLSGLLFGLVIISAAAAAGLFGVLAIWTAHQEKTNDRALLSLGINKSADREWEAEWPTLTFPRRAGSAIPATVLREYDKFRDFTAFTAEPIILTLFVGEPGNIDTPSKPPRIIRIWSRDRDSDELIFLADGVRIEPRFVNGGWELSTKDLLSLVFAKVVECRCEGREFLFNEHNRQVLRDFASILKP